MSNFIELIKVYFHYGVALRLKAFKRVATRRNALHGALLRVAARCGALKGAETSLGRILMS